MARIRKSILCWLALSPLLVVIVFPFAVMFFTAVKPRDELFVFPPRWLPSRFVWSNFTDMWVATGFGQALVNSLYVAIVSTVLALVIGIPAAYALSRYRFGGKGLYRQFLLITQMVSPWCCAGAVPADGGAGRGRQPEPAGRDYGAFKIAFHDHECAEITSTRSACRPGGGGLESTARTPAAEPAPDLPAAGRCRRWWVERRCSPSSKA